MLKKLFLFTFVIASSFILYNYFQKSKTDSKVTYQDVQKAEIEAQEKAKAELIEIGKESDGAKIYREKIQKDCNMASGYTIASKKTKKEWEEIAKNGKLAEAIKSFCPSVKFNNLWTPDIYEYLHKNAPST